MTLSPAPASNFLSNMPLLILPEAGVLGEACGSWSHRTQGCLGRRVRGSEGEGGGAGVVLGEG